MRGLYRGALFHVSTLGRDGRLLCCREIMGAIIGKAVLWRVCYAAGFGVGRRVSLFWVRHDG